MSLHCSWPFTSSTMMYLGLVIQRSEKGGFRDKTNRASKSGKRKFVQC